MLAKKSRLNLSEFENRRLLRTGRRWQASGLEFYFDFKSETGGKAAVVVPKFFFPKASERIALRRLVFSAIEPFLKINHKLRLIIKLTKSLALNQPEKFYKEIFQQFFQQVGEET